MDFGKTILEWLYETFGLSHPGLSYLYAFMVGGLLTALAWFFVGYWYRKAHPLPTPAVVQSINAAQSRPAERAPAGPVPPTKSTSNQEPRVPVVRQTAPPPLRKPLEEQITVVRGLVRQVHAQGHSEMWLSQILFAMRTGGLDGIPVGGAVDYSAALREMAKRGEIEILETARRESRDIWGEVFADDIRFRVLKLPE